MALKQCRSTLPAARGCRSFVPFRSRAATVKAQALRPSSELNALLDCQPLPQELPCTDTSCGSAQTPATTTNSSSSSSLSTSSSSSSWPAPPSPVGADPCLLPTGSEAVVTTSRRILLASTTTTAAAAAAAAAAAWVAPPPPPAAASALPAFADRAWEAMGGGPSDLFFPEAWLGVWDVTSVLMSVETPLGQEVLPNPLSVQRALQEDLNNPQAYQVAFMRNGESQVIYDRRFNTASLLASYYGAGTDFAGRIRWDPNNPNVLSLSLPGSAVAQVRTRVTRRSEASVADDRLETSEFMEQVFEDGTGTPRVKASRCFTKYKWRDEAAAVAAGGGPVIVATQVVSDYLTPYDGEGAYLKAGDRPVAVYTYRMAFSRHHNSSSSMSAALHAS